ncbi:pulmonary surfactant-associated protein A-like [Camarhynchus parvulus]|uniref:pulmonary surfactant-associated protein A-like n=1 Tax=Geospiza parvula TaxID=87175 RepID=UPI00123815AA|nr:pulmonary surfactant-associated protein A-like [Camarhynchus parvulus]
MRRKRRRVCSHSLQALPEFWQGMIHPQGSRSTPSDKRADWDSGMEKDWCTQGHSINNAAGSVGTPPRTKVLGHTSEAEVSVEVQAQGHSACGGDLALPKPSSIGKLAGFLPFPFKPLFGERSNSADEQQIPDLTALAGNKHGDPIHQLEYRISRLEGVLRLNKMITESGGKIFATNGKKADFDGTVEKCKEAGGSIATPKSPGENDAILYFVKYFNTYAYLGIKQSLIPGRFQLLNGAQLSYTNWYSNEPSGKGQEECVEMYTDGTWNDKICNKNHLIVCQF